GGRAAAAARLLRSRDAAHHARHAVARYGQRPAAVPRMISDLLTRWMTQFTVLAWLAIAFVAAVLEVSVPHFGSAFIGAGAIAAAAAAFFGFDVPIQIGTFVVVLIVSLVGLRSRLVGRLGGRGVPSRTDPLIGRQGLVTHE